ncbi:hypothetical protein DEU56DRAFT_762189 [Suillus clintonianus]|uniref:uncharacterized protein n=1 Tax=Suillus clintonianus TaxID=1904413 RepID=UPI001B886738|nr:uncharacterized protein DEU56DRAFT_762189 [Suillus clintonianus]KAG2111448.1 hypothetical protein DEU56DRAFT_762189 [Suillus clintonianus]
MSTTEASRRTRASNAMARPGKIVLDAQTKRRTKAQKAADDLAIKEAREAKEALVQKGVERLANMQVEMEKVQKELLTNKAAPIRPKPKARKARKCAVKSGDDTNGTLDDAPEDDVAEDATEAADHGTSGKGKKAGKKSGKTLIRDAISNVQKKISESSLNAEGDNANDIDKARVDGKGSTPSTINAATHKFALGGRVTNWVSGVRPGKSEPTSRQSSASTRAPPTSIFSDDAASSAATSAAQPQIQVPAAPAKIADGIPEDDVLTGSFADEIDDSLEREAACLESKQNKGKSKVASIFEEDSDFEGPKAPFTQIPPIVFDSDDEVMAPFTQQVHDHMATSPLKRKASADSVLDSDAESHWSMDIDRDDVVELSDDLIEDYDSEPEPEPIVVKKEKKQRLTTSTSATTTTDDNKPPAAKKVKVEFSGTTLAHGAQAPAKKRRQNVDTAPEHMKSRGAYRTSDLPPAMQADQRWTKKFIPTIMMWAGSYDDIWSIPDDVLLHHVQLVFDVVYPELKIVIVHGGVIHLLTAQRISEWRSNFGSTGIVIIIDFLARNSDCDSSTLASSLLASWAFLYEDPDNINPLTAYRSPFILQLYGRAHLNAISGHVVIPSLDMQALDTMGMSRVLALSAAALERALGMIARKELKVQDILLSASRGKFTIKLPKVLNKATGKKTNAPFLFSAARWSKATNSYIKSILSKPTGYVEATVKMALTALQDVIETPGSFIECDEDEDERAMILRKE